MKDIFCTKCQFWKTPASFSFRKDGRLRRPCNECSKQRMHQYNLKMREKNQLRYQKEKSARLAKQMEKAYGITPALYQQMLKQQKNCCKLCGKKFEKTIKRPHIDHDHKTGKVRGILHAQCNALLGLANDDAGILEAAIQYLDQ